jgi:WD40 repeat protein
MIASASVDNTIKLWRLDGIGLTSVSVLETKEEQMGHTESVNQVVFSPDGEKIASASTDGTVKLWSWDGKLDSTFYSHTDAVYGVAFSPDGQMIASAGRDKIVMLWGINQVSETEKLQTEGCKLLRNYLATNTELDESDRQICNSIKKSE